MADLTFESVETPELITIRTTPMPTAETANSGLIRELRELQKPTDSTPPKVETTFPEWHYLDEFTVLATGSTVQGWRTLNVSSLIPAGVKIIRCEVWLQSDFGNTATDVCIKVRKNGSTAAFYANRHYIYDEGSDEVNIGTLQVVDIPLSPGGTFDFTADVEAGSDSYIDTWYLKLIAYYL